MSDDRNILPPVDVEPVKETPKVTYLQVVEGSPVETIGALPLIRQPEGRCSHRGRVKVDLVDRVIICRTCNKEVNAIGYVLVLHEYIRSLHRRWGRAIDEQEKRDASEEARARAAHAARRCSVPDCREPGSYGCRHDFGPTSRRVACRRGVCAAHGHTAPIPLCLTHAPKKARTA